MEEKTLEDYLTPKQVAALLEIPYSRSLVLIKSGRIDATKNNHKWQINPKDFKKFNQRNKKQINKLKAEYVLLYWQGLDPERLEKRVGEDFKSKGIIGNKKWFATLAILESLTARRNK